MLKVTEPGADLTKFTFFVQEEVPRTAEGPLVTLLLQRPKARQADWTALRDDVVTSTVRHAFIKRI